MKLFFSLAFAAALAAPLSGLHAGSLTPPDGPPQPTMKTLDQVEPGTPIGPEDVPYTITEPGRYYLTGNVDLTENTTATITIAASHVTLDLQGFRVRQTITAAIYLYSADDQHDVTIRNGHLGGVDGLETVNDIPGLLLENLSIQTQDRGMTLAGGATVRDCRISGSNVGIYIVQGGAIDANGTTISTCDTAVFTELDDQPLILSGLSVTDCELGFILSKRAILRDCQAVGDKLFHNVQNGVQLERCFLMFSNGHGFDASNTANISLTGCILINQTPTVEATAIQAGDFASIQDTQIRNFSCAIAVDNHTSIENVSITMSGSDGQTAIASAGSLSVFATTISGEYSTAIDMGETSIVSGCTIQCPIFTTGNTAIYASTSSLISDCTLVGYSHGIEASRTAIENCRIIYRSAKYYQGQTAIQGNSLTLSGTTISGYQTAIEVSGTQISDCRISECGTGLDLNDEYCLAANNIIQAGIGIVCSDATLTGNVIHATSGPAIDNRSNNCVIVGNIASGGYPGDLLPNINRYSGGTVGPVIYGDLSESDEYPDTGAPNPNTNPWANVVSE